MKNSKSLPFLLTLLLLASCSSVHRAAYSPSDIEIERSRTYHKKSNNWIYYQDDEVTEYVCPRCGSHDVLEVVSKRGFSAGKALAGEFFFGPVGLLAGAAGQNKIIINLKCRRCGNSHKF